MPDPQFVIGVDLGTTNSAVAYAELALATASGAPRVRVFDVPQLVAEGETATRETLPSFLYLLSEEERRSGRFGPPWAADAPHVAGVWARDQGALVPGRLVSSAKSWLCNDAVDRRAPLLPWGGEAGTAACSPVEASAAYLAHLRDAWNHVFAGGRRDAPRSFEQQAVTLTVPASFDEEARELTVEAARQAGLERLAMIEEPTAALYAWIASHRGRLEDFLRHGDRVLIVDVGGGTTDFTLVSVALGEEGPEFERIAVGEHLLLGGDNLDLALTGLIQDRLGRPRLGARQQQALRRRCAAVKEHLLGPPPVDREAVSVLGSGASVVGGALTAEVERGDVLRLLLDGFLPACPLDAAPEGERRSGLRELGLPFATDPAVTRHLAAFLRSAAEGGAARPDALLLNGGFFTPDEARARLVEVVSGWFAGELDGHWAPRALVNRSPAVAVAEGAAYSGLVRRGFGLRIGGGSPRACFIALGDSAADGGRAAGRARPGGGAAGGGTADRGAASGGAVEGGTADGSTARGASADGGTARGAVAAGSGRRAVCVLPRGTREGTSHRLEGREFVVRTNRPLSFTLLSSLASRAAFGDVATLDAAQVHRHAPLVTELRFGKRSRDTEVKTALEIDYTELGTLELWIVAPETGHRWRLQFQLRAAPRAASSTEDESARPSAVVDPTALAAAVQLVKSLRGGHDAGASVTPDNLMARLEETLGFAKGAWPIATVRPMADALIEAMDARGTSPRHEARWLNLLGYCLRPGFGAALDDWRMTQARRLYLGGLAFPADVQCQAEWLVLWQRVAGGLTPGQQREIFARQTARMAGGGKKAKRLPPQVEREEMRLCASLEHVASRERRALGDDLLSRLRREPRSATLLWAIGRTGARVPLYGPLNTVVDPTTAAGWVRALLDTVPLSPECAATIVQLAARTGDPARDLDEDFCRETHDRLAAAGLAPAALVRLVEVQAPSEIERVRGFGESLPEGLRLLERADSPR